MRPYSLLVERSPQAERQVKKDSAHVGRKPTQVEKEPEYAEKGGVPKVWTPSSQVRTTTPYHLEKKLFSILESVEIII